MTTPASSPLQALARILTGWRVGAARADSDTGGFYFDAAFHDPSDKTLLGRTIKGTGLGEGAQALGLLAVHALLFKDGGVFRFIRVLHIDEHFPQPAVYPPDGRGSHSFIPLAWAGSRLW